MRRRVAGGGRLDVGGRRGLHGAEPYELHLSGSELRFKRFDATVLLDETGLSGEVTLHISELGDKSLRWNIGRFVTKMLGRGKRVNEMGRRWDGRLGRVSGQRGP